MRFRFFSCVIFAFGLFAFGLFAASSQAIAQSDGQTQEPPALVEVAEAINSLIAPSMQTPGTIVSLNDSRIAAEIAGRLTWVAPEGTNLKAGDVIARIENRDLDIAVRRLKASLRRLDARVGFLKSELQRSEELVAQGNASASRAQQAKSDLVSAEQDLVEARLQLEQASLNLDRSEVKAPFPGRVVERLSQIGEYATPGAQIVRLVDTENLEVVAQVPVRLASFLTENSPVTLTVGDMQKTGKIRALVPVGDVISRTMDVRISLGQRQDLVVGSALSVSLPASEPEKVIAVPQDALILRTDGTYIFRITDRGTAERLRVRTGTALEDIVAIFGDVTPGDQVIIRGGERLRAGQTVKLTTVSGSSVSGPSVSDTSSD